MKYKVNLVSSIVAASLMLSACSASKLSMEHIHGLGYSTDGKQIMIPAHTGLVVYSGSKWSHVDAPQNDYMGFVAVDNGFYSSGHPGVGSNLKNPIGIVKSSDMGKTITKLDLEGSSDFHGMTVGYKTHTIYVFNAQPNPKMKSAGLYYTKDDAKTWSKSEMNGFSGEPLTLATHPSDDKVIALGSKEGLYLSNDSGNHFEKLFPGLVVASLAFSNTGELFIAATNSPTMFQFNLSSKEKKEIKLPTLDKGDAISYIAQNPTDSNEIALATFNKDIFISKDVGAKWTEIADKGKGISK
ncbi:MULTISPECIES: F510_1955 family glycosylhydrolase [unclassified Paenibacillus]|uniref:F510_1955 family glycosylhydrolase n=1 Tax=unclassified Paenibacillus TaxID=185978 RepID=UPI0027882282|nr:MULTISPECIES: hypothetical protein [unclassified Paenibacillus]MDQ0900731.1 photosystem II stability/assembly factor-like uncharacterized protein [Paenibacillus sp. V4I7]MDQ0920759.1 photosystem II stability/assembly factor-like uncharacterized protein [Paenibacillus sp. V4I5]